MAIIVKDKVEFGKRLKETRTKKNVSQKSLSTTLGLKSSGSVSLWESGKQLPTDEMLTKLAESLSISEDFLLTGETEKSDPAPRFDHRKTEEGYFDKTASTAMDNVWFSGKTADEGDLVDNKNGELFVVLKKIDNNTAVMASVQTTPITNHLNFAVLKNGDASYYVNLASFGTKGRFLKDYRRKFKVSEVSFQAIKNKFNKLLGVDPVLINIVEESSKDEISKVFADSLSYYNKKNNTNFTCKAKVTLQDAIDISRTSGISLEDLCRDHEMDQKMDRIKELKAELEKLESEVGGAK